MSTYDRYDHAAKTWWGVWKDRPEEEMLKDLADAWRESAEQILALQARIDEKPPA